MDMWRQGQKQEQTQLYSRKLPNQLLIFSFGCATLFHLHFSFFCIECRNINLICIFFPFSTLIFSNCVRFQEDYRVTERRKKNKATYKISHLSNFLKLRMFSRKVGIVWLVLRFFPSATLTSENSERKKKMCWRGETKSYAPVLLPSVTKH